MVMTALALEDRRPAISNLCNMKLKLPFGVINLLVFIILTTFFLKFSISIVHTINTDNRLNIFSYKKE